MAGVVQDVQERVVAHIWCRNVRRGGSRDAIRRRLGEDFWTVIPYFLTSSGMEEVAIWTLLFTLMVAISGYRTEFERYRQGHVPLSVADRFHVDHIVDAVDLAFQRGCDYLHPITSGVARVVSRHSDLRRDEVRELRHGQCDYGYKAEQYYYYRTDRGQYRSSDEYRGEHLLKPHSAGFSPSVLTAAALCGCFSAIFTALPGSTFATPSTMILSPSARPSLRQVFLIVLIIFMFLTDGMFDRQERTLSVPKRSGSRRSRAVQ